MASNCSRTAGTQLPTHVGDVRPMMAATVSAAGEIPVAAIATVLRVLTQLAACLLPPPVALPWGAMQERLHVARRHVAFLERVAPHDPRVLECVPRSSS